MAEAIGVIFLIWIGWALVKWILRTTARTGTAAFKAATGEGSFADNLASQFYTMGAFEIRITESRLGDDGDGPLIMEIQGRGLIPVWTPTNIGFMTSVFDVTDGDPEPVLSHMENFQEPTTIAFQHVIGLGSVGVDQGFGDWSQVGAVLPDILQPPVGGNRRIQILVRMVDLDDMPDIMLGFGGGDSGTTLWTAEESFEHFFEEKGYQEASADIDEGRALAIKIGMAVAMADGSLDDREGETLREWIVRSISPFGDDKQAELKSIYNDAMREAYEQAEQGELSLTPLTERLNEIGERAQKYETIELCFDVMAADGVADAEELRTIRRVAEALELDYEEIEKMRDQKIINLDASVSNQASIEDMIGIEPDWSNDQVNRHLRGEFQKWNARLNTLAEGEERDNAQLMLDRIAEARSKYA